MTQQKLLEELPYKLRRLREAAGLNQLQAAKLARTHQAQISGWELGKNYPTLESMLLLAEAYGTTVAEILNQEHPKVAPPRPPSKVEMAIWIMAEIGIPPNKIEFVRGVIGGIHV